MMRDYYKKMPGDRKDGWKLRNVPLFFTVVPFIMRTRLDSQNYYEETLDVEPMMDFLKAHKEDMPNISMMTIWPDYANAWWNIRHSAPRISPCAREWRSTIKTLSARLCVLWSRTYANYAICDRFCAHINRISRIDCITKKKRVPNPYIRFSARFFVCFRLFRLLYLFSTII